MSLLPSNQRRKVGRHRLRLQLPGQSQPRAPDPQCIWPEKEEVPEGLGPASAGLVGSRCQRPCGLGNRHRNARREAHWRCPDCGTQFISRVLDMVGCRECPRCEPQRRAAEQVELERYADTQVAAMPELLAAWADEADPTTVPVAGGYELRRFRCPRGHHPRMTPLSFLRSGCPSCRGQKTLEERLASVEVDP